MAFLYDGFDIESFEAGKGLWHARIRRADREPVVIDGIAFSALDVGFAWNDPEAAIAHARSHIDRCGLRSQGKVSGSVACSALRSGRASPPAP